MTLVFLLYLVTGLWPMSEIILAIVRRKGHSGASVEDRGSMALLWFVIAASVVAAVSIRIKTGRTIPIAPIQLVAAGLIVLVAGLAIRWAAILTLGRLFTTAVTIQTDHRIIRRGLYRWVRHPSYSGLLLAFLGMGVAYGSWLGILLLLAPITAAVIYRIRVEEQALMRTFGQEYEEYRDSTKCLLPGIY